MKTEGRVPEDVITDLKWEPSVDAAQIGVEVKDEIVTRAGHVNGFAEMWSAKRAAQCVSGVEALAIEINVKLQGLGHRTDTDVAHWAENIDAEVTLTGDVHSWSERELAANSAWNAPGVRNVVNKISLSY
jgi:osmotically-inducible protein OsmY